MHVAMPLTVSCLALVLAFPALAADLEAASKIDAVTVYPDAASVTRIAEVELPAGATKLVFKGLPLDIDPASLRVEGEAAGKLTIGSVETAVAPVEAQAPDSGLDARIKALRADREATQVTLDGLEGRKAMIVRFSQAAPDKLGADAKPLDMSQWNAAWDMVGAALTKVGDELRVAHGRARELDEEIQGLEASRQQPAATTGPGRDITVALEADAGTKATITLTYRIAGAQWRPLYDARLDTADKSAKPSLELVRRAAIVQHTGEAWTDVSLTVSTVRTEGGTAAPDMQPVRVAFYDVPEPEADASVPHAYRKSASPPVGGVASEAAPATVAPAPPRPAEEAHATLDAGAFQASFHVGGRVTVPGDGTQKSFRLGTQTLTPTLVVKTVPAIEQIAYLNAHFVNDGDAPLLPGEVALVRDGTFVGTSQFALVAPGDSLDLGFGADDRVKVVRVPIKRKENDPSWFGSNKIEADEFKTTVKNLHDFPIKVSIVDRIPISETTTIVVEQLPGTTPPTEKIVGDRRGVMGWTYDLQPGETKEIHLAYRMKWPADRDVTFDEAPVASR